MDLKLFIIMKIIIYLINKLKILKNRKLMINNLFYKIFNNKLKMNKF